MLNVVVLEGRLCKDPELRYATNGTPICNLRLAVDRGTKDAQGNKETDFIDCVLFKQQAETASNHLQKGRLVSVKGRLQIRQYENNEGQRREKAEIIVDPAFGLNFLDRGNSNPAGGGDEEIP